MTSGDSPDHGVRLRRGPDWTLPVGDDLLDLGRWEAAPGAAGPAVTGQRVGLAGVLAGPFRTARAGDPPGTATVDGFRWDAADQQSTRWWPQGITTSADHDPSETYAGRRLVVTTAYARPHGGRDHGSRITVTDVTDPERLRYQHVRLVEPVQTDHGLVLSPLRAHVGGVVWHGPLLYVACTGRGLACLRVDDVVRLGEPGAAGGTGHSYLLPVAFRYEAEADRGVEGLRYSFLSLDRGTPERRRPGGHDVGSGPTPDAGPGLVVGEYGRPGMSHRLARYALDPETSLLVESADRSVRPHLLHPGGTAQMQGAVVVDGRWYVTTSHGTRRGGSLLAGRPGELARLRDALPPGPEDIAYVPSTDRLWTLTEHPGQRWVCTVDRADLERRIVRARRLRWLPDPSRAGATLLTGLRHLRPSRLLRRGRRRT